MEQLNRTLVWDLPTRIFHWTLAASFTAAWLTSGEDEWLSIHSFFGWLLLAMTGFRLVWGLVGGRYARFSSFAYGPASAMSYLRALLKHRAARYLGHNPAGSQAIFLLLGLGLVVSITGVLVQGGEEQQLLAKGVTQVANAGLFKQAHEWAADLMLLVVAGHLLGVAVDSWLTRENLPRSMVTGVKPGLADLAGSKAYVPVGAAMIAAILLFAIWWFSYLFPMLSHGVAGPDTGPSGAPHVAFTGPKLPDDPLWRTECGACHLAFHPNLLPARSWLALIAGQGSHFGSDLALDQPSSATIGAFLVKNAAETSPREAAYKINRSIPASQTPLRITETPYWITKHRDIAQADWRSLKIKSKSNCAACHRDAEAGTFEDSAMHIPH